MRRTFERVTDLTAVLVLAGACATMEAPQTGLTVASSPAGSAPTYGIFGSDSYFTVQWQADERRGKPIVSGYVTNTSGWSMRKVRVRVESLDSAGAVTATHIGYVNGDVTAGSRLYYEVAVGAKAPSYRVSVLSFELVQGFGGA